MDVGLGLTIVDLCIKYGKQLYEVCQAYKHADREVREGILSIEGVWLKTETQVDAIRKMWGSLDERLQIHQNHVLALLQEKLQIAISIINGLDTMPSDEPTLKILISRRGDMKKLKYATYVKGLLDRILRDLEDWHRRFDPSWYLLARATAPPIDQHITTKEANLSKELYIIQELRHVHRMNDVSLDSRNSVFLPKEYSIQERKPIANTSTETGYVGQQVVVIDSLRIAKEKDLQVATKDARDIARTLANVDPSVFSLLSCQGIIKAFDSSNQVTGFEFIFAVPTAFEDPRSLRTVLLANHDYPLDDRFRLAKLLGRSVSFLHSSQVVHKNITPETILLFRDSATGLDTPFLVGFEKFRRVEGRTYMSGDTFWEKNLYRHPKRQGERPEEVQNAARYLQPWYPVSDRGGQVIGLSENKGRGNYPEITITYYYLSCIIVEDGVESRIQEIIQSKFEIKKLAAAKELMTLIEDEKRQPITYNHYYTDNILNARHDAMKGSIQKAMHSVVENDWSRTWQVNNTPMDSVRLLASL
ncbi:hypothetical protein V500_02029 [Pseudogymnoascus sp. VKM F-4518 (FW-2643)]|nr:hypothetical protein V500_02029 [Pseudogymnoascus sp. VKM F-4518 (FW-2643)]